MNFKLIPDFTQADIKKITDEFLSRVTKVTMNELMQVGLEFVREARSKRPDAEYDRDASDIVAATNLAGGSIDHSGAGSFNDQTGNLRSSIFFIIGVDGKISHEDFEESERGTDKSTGVEEARLYAGQVLEEWPAGLVLITGAAMEYASYVEAKGYDVITGSTLEAKAKLEGLIQRVLMAFEQ